MLRRPDDAPASTWLEIRETLFNQRLGGPLMRVLAARGEPAISDATPRSLRSPEQFPRPSACEYLGELGDRRATRAVLLRLGVPRSVDLDADSLGFRDCGIRRRPELRLTAADVLNPCLAHAPEDLMRRNSLVVLAVFAAAGCRSVSGHMDPDAPPPAPPSVNPAHLHFTRAQVQVGDVAPDFTLARTDGTGDVTLSDLRGKPTVLVFGSFT